MGNGHELQPNIPGDLCLTDCEIKSILARDRVQMSYLQGFCWKLFQIVGNLKTLSIFRVVFVSGSEGSDKSRIKFPLWPSLLEIQLNAAARALLIPVAEKYPQRDKAGLRKRGHFPSSIYLFVLKIKPAHPELAAHWTYTHRALVRS